MNTKYRSLIMIVAVISMALSGCGAATQVAGATPTSIPWGPSLSVSMEQVLVNLGYVRTLEDDESWCITYPCRVYVNESLNHSTACIYNDGNLAINFGYFVGVGDSGEGGALTSILANFPQSVSDWILGAIASLGNEPGSTGSFNEVVNGYGMFVSLQLDGNEYRYNIGIQRPDLSYIYGDISGTPNQDAPDLYVVAFSQTTPYYYWTATTLDNYMIDLLPADGYRIVAYDSAGNAGGCSGLVVISSGAPASCNITDWNGVYPPMPDEIR